MLIYILMIINRGIKLLENESQAKRGKQLGIGQAGPHPATIDDLPFSLKKKKKKAKKKQESLRYLKI